MNTLASVFFCEDESTKKWRISSGGIGETVLLGPDGNLNLGGPRILGEGASNPVTINCTWHTVKCCERGLRVIQEKMTLAMANSIFGSFFTVMA